MTVDQTSTAIPTRADAEQTIKHITDNTDRIFSWDDSADETSSQEAAERWSIMDAARRQR